MKMEIVTPEEHFGDVLGDIGSRRGQGQGAEPRGNAHVIQAQAPLSETFGYATDLRSLTQGRATYSMEFDHYARVPDGIVEEITDSSADWRAAAG